MGVARDQGRPDPHTLAHLRSPDQERLGPGSRTTRSPRCRRPELVAGPVTRSRNRRRRPEARRPDEFAGQWRRRDAEIVVATASLEVGFDDDRVGAVLQHKAPHDVAQFLQRKGRAGRDAKTRPWTVVVLSDWGRDRDAWDAYDALFSPVVPARSLPIENLYVLRIQAVYSLLDWLAQELGSPGRHVGRRGRTGGTAGQVGQGPGGLPRVRHDGGPAGPPAPRRDRARVAAPAPAPQPRSRRGRSPTRSWTRFSGRPRGRCSPPWCRPCAAVSSTSGRASGRHRTTPVRSRTPLRDFVPGNLFDELMVPDVEFQVPWKRGEVRTEQLPALRAIREFLPGSVSRHFGVSVTNKRHWVPLPDEVDEHGSRWVDVATYGGASSTRVAGEEDAGLRTDRGALGHPRGSGTPMPRSCQTGTSRPRHWAEAHSPPLPRRWGRWFARLTAHLHVQGGGVPLLRYARSGVGFLWIKGAAPPENPVRHPGGRQLARPPWGSRSTATPRPGRSSRRPSTISDIGRAEWAWLEQQVLTGVGIPERPLFDRSALAEVLATWRGLGLAPTGPVVGRVRGGSETPDRLGSLVEDADTLSVWLQEPAIQAVLLRRSWRREGRRARALEMWLRRRHTLSAANLLLTSLTSWGSGVDADELTVDLDPDDDSVFDISEQSPGTGQIEALTRTVVENPDTLGMALLDAIRPSDLELMDVELRAVLGDLAGDAARDPGTGGLVAPRTRRGAGGDCALETEVIGPARLGHAARTALATRLAGPAPRRTGEEVSVDGFARLRGAFQGFGGRTTLLGDIAGRPVGGRRGVQVGSPGPGSPTRAVSNVLWPWAPQSGGPGRSTPSPDRSTVLRRRARSLAVVHHGSRLRGVGRRGSQAGSRGARSVGEVIPRTGRPPVPPALGRASRSSDSFRSRSVRCSATADHRRQRSRRVCRRAGPAEGVVVNRIIRKSRQNSAHEAAELLAGLFTAELSAPSTSMWLVSPWISDVELIDNTAGTFAALSRFGRRRVRLTEILVAFATVAATWSSGPRRTRTTHGFSNDWRPVRGRPGHIRVTVVVDPFEPCTRRRSPVTTSRCPGA